MAEQNGDSADVVVVGAGVSGAITSLILAEAGIDVVCLEQGGRVAPGAFPHFDADWEWQRSTAWHPEPNTRRGEDDYPVETDSEATLMWNAVGGSSVIYTALWPRYRPSDFRKGDEHGLAPNWPITYEELAPFYDEADRLLGVSGLAGDPGGPAVAAYPTPPLPIGAVGRRLAAGFDRLGWHWWPMPAAVISQDYDGRPGCNGCGGCIAGCPRGSMSNVALSVWPKALRAGARLRTRARALSVETDRAGRATGVVYADREAGCRRRVRAQAVVLACNGVGTPRLLLASGDLANSSGQVGRNLTHHTLVGTEMWVDAPLASHTGSLGAVISQQFAETDTGRGFVNGFNFNCVGMEGAGLQSLGFLAPGGAPWGEGHHDWFRRHFGHGFVAFAIGDDIPRPENRVTLSADACDADGLPVPRIEYAPHANDWAMMAFARERLQDLAGAVDSFAHRTVDYVDPLTGRYRPPAWHLLGTCRMGDDRATSVVDRWNRCWDVPNLLVVDGSALATAGAVNPTPTIAAVAVRAARHLRDSRGRV
ncbi:MAG: GMC family oxidoreductase [Alphaproteobacteria bacterium]